MTKSPFDFLNSISYTKEDLTDNIDEYNAWMVNRGLSLHQDTILFANEMNLNHHLPPKAQYQFYINIVGKRKRYGKWPKAEQNEDINLVSEYYKVNKRLAAEYNKILSSEQKEEIKRQMITGGIKKEE